MDQEIIKSQLGSVLDVWRGAADEVWTGGGEDGSGESDDLYGKGCDAGMDVVYLPG